MIYKRHTNLKEMILANLNLKFMYGMFDKITAAKRCGCQTRSKINGQCMFDGQCNEANLIYMATCMIDGKHYIVRAQNDTKTRIFKHHQCGQILVKTAASKPYGRIRAQRHHRQHSLNRFSISRSHNSLTYQCYIPFRAFCLPLKANKSLSPIPKSNPTKH